MEILLISGEDMMISGADQDDMESLTLVVAREYGVNACSEWNKWYDCSMRIHERIAKQWTFKFNVLNLTFLKKR